MRRRQRWDTVSLAGWLFADLLLALVVVTLASGTGRSHAAGDDGEGESDEAVTTTLASTTTTTTVAPAGVEPEPYTFEVAADYDALMGPDGPAKGAERARIVAEIQAHFAEAGLTSRRVGIVLTFGMHPNPDSGTALAASYNELLRVAQPQMFEGATMRDFWKSSGATGAAVFEVYFLR